MRPGMPVSCSGASLDDLGGRTERGARVARLRVSNPARTSLAASEPTPRTGSCNCKALLYHGKQSQHPALLVEPGRPQPPTAGFHPLHPPAAGLPNCPATRLGVNSARWGRRGRPVRTPASVFPAGELRPLATLWRRPAASCSLSPNVASTPLTSPGACPAAGQGSDRVWAPSGAFSHGYCSGWRCNAFPAMLQHHIATSRRWEPQGPRQLAAPIWRRCWGPMGRQGRAIVMGRGTQQLPEPAGEPRKRACLLGSSGTRGCKGGAACDAPLGI